MQGRVHVGAFVCSSSATDPHSLTTYACTHTHRDKHTHTRTALCPLFVLFFFFPFADPSGAVAHISLSPLLPHPFITKVSQMLTSTHGERDRREWKEGVKRASV